MTSQNLQQRKTNASDLIEDEANIAKSINSDYQEKYGFKDDYEAVTDIGKGINEDIIRKISKLKNEDNWMLDFRLKAYEHFLSRPMPTWGADLSEIDFNNIHYFVRATDKQGRDWNEVPDKIKNTFEKLGIPQAERKFLAGVATQYESEVIYNKIHTRWNELGVRFLDTDSAYKQFPEIFREHFGKVIPYNDNKFAALNSAVWSGGSYVYVPKGVKVAVPLQAYFRINAQNMGQFERTLIIADEGSEVHYIEGCFPKGTKIKTNKGLLAIEEIKKGDKVLTHSGNYKNVYHTQVRSYSGLLYTLRALNKNTDDITATSEHPFLVVKQENIKQKNTYEWIPISEIQVGDYVCIPIEKSNTPLTSTREFSDNMYIYTPVKEITTKEATIDVYNFGVEEDESYVAGGLIVHNCTAPIYTTDSLHSAVVEIVVKKGARVRYTTIQNWSDNVYNLVTKRAFAYEDAIMEWVDCNLGSKVTMKYPSVYLLKPGSHGEVLSIALAGANQHLDAGAKIIHRAPNTSSIITSKSICKDGGRTSYRGLLRISKGAVNSKSTVICDALILDNKSRTDTYPTNEINEKQISLGHEASVSKVDEEQLFYLMSRGLSESEASSLIVSGFIEPIVKELPMEYALELNALIHMSMEGSVG